LVLIGGGTYLYSQKRVANAPSDVKTQTSISSDQPGELPVAVRLLSATTSYASLTDYEKSLVNRYVQLHPDITADSGDPAAVPTDFAHPIYYNKNIVLFGIDGFKGLYYRMVNARTFDSKNITGVYSNGIPGCHQYTNYIFCTFDSGIYYLKTGNNDFVFIPNSSIINTEKETYIYACDPAGCYEDVNFDESSKLLSIGVYDK